MAALPILRKTINPDGILLYRAIDLQGRGGFPSFGDLDGDGRIDFLFTVGRRFLTAFDHDGMILWKREDHSGWVRMEQPNFQMTTNVYDLDGDGQVEVLTVLNLDGIDSLCVLEGKTGRLLHAVPWPTGRNFDNHPDNWDNIRARVIVANITGKQRTEELYVVHYRDTRRDRMYGSVFAMDKNLNILWQRHNVNIAHCPQAADIDGDGCDELAAGATILDHDGRILWEFDIEATRSKDDDPHVDGILLANIDGNLENGLEVAVTPGASLFSSNGRLLWNHKGLVNHCQRVRAGKVRPDQPGLELLFCEHCPVRKRQDAILIRWLKDIVKPLPKGKIFLLNSRGELLWSRSVLRQDAGFINWSGSCVDEIFTHDSDGLTIINGYKALLEKIYWDDPALISLPDYKVKWTPSESDHHQCPPTHFAMALDLTGDEREELLISNAHYLLIFANQALNKCENKLYSDDQRKKLHNFTFY